MSRKSDRTIIKENGCDLIALTLEEKVVGYTKSDKEIIEWEAKNQDDDYTIEEREMYGLADYEHKYNWFCVEY
jgi:hypothetical protein